MNVMKTTDKPTLSIILRGNIVALEDGLIFRCKVLKLQSAAGFRSATLCKHRHSPGNWSPTLEKHAVVDFVGPLVEV